MHLSVAIPGWEEEGKGGGGGEDLLTLVVTFKPGMKGLDSFCTLVARSLGIDLLDS